MRSRIIDIVKNRIEDKHQGDKHQLDVIFSPSKRILVEAPAGYGKTNTMVSKIAYMIATGEIPNPKKLLALTFSVNAAYKIKKDVTQQVPALLSETGLNVVPTDKLFVSNYHGFCRSILKKYGMVFHSNLKSIDTLQSLDDANAKNIQQAVKGLTYDEAQLLSNYSEALKNIEKKFLSTNFDIYCDIVIKKLIPAEAISYNGILTLVLKLFREHPKILEFYQKYFTAVLVDEYQDTNLVSYRLLQHLITDSTKVILLGDSLQRIYGFIGAVPDLLTISEQKFNLTKIKLSKNYRFASNPDMLQLDSNIRRNAEDPTCPKILKDAAINLITCDDQQEESSKIVELAISLSQRGNVAILVKQRGENVNRIIEQLAEDKVPFFFGLFTDEQPDYIRFHRHCLFEFIELLKSKGQITKKLSKDHISKIEQIYEDKESSLSDALIQLLGVFWKKVFSDYSAFSNDEKILLIRDTFEHNGLKQYLEFVSANIIVSTVHGAKGLEWDYVILPDMEQDSFPGYFGLCKDCGCRSDCNLSVNKANESSFLEELSVFYVAVTRARKQVYFTTSEIALDSRGNERAKNMSCFLNLPGIIY